MKRGYGFGKFFILFLVVLAVVFVAEGNITEVGLENLSDKVWLNTNTTTFDCNATADNGTTVMNITLMVWNASTGGHVNGTWINFTSGDYGYGNGSENGTLSVNFTVSNLSQMHGSFNYSWNCLAALNNGTANYSNANRTFGVDLTAPSVAGNVLGVAGPNEITNRTSFNFVGADRAFQFSFNATDALGALVMHNCSLFLDDVYNTSNISTNINASPTNFSIATLDYDNSLEWYVKCWDNATNSNQTGTYVMDTLTIATTHTGVANDSWFTNTSPNGFNCSATPTTYASVGKAANITNVTFMVWNASSAAQVYNHTINVSGSENGTWSALFNITGHTNLSNSSNGTVANGTGALYYWNCLAYDNNTNLMYNISDNRTFGIDTWSPNLTAISPADGVAIITGSVDFSYVPTDIVGEKGVINNCSLIFDGVTLSTSYSVTNNVQQTFTLDPPGATDASWYVKCYDKSGLSGTTSTRLITTMAAESTTTTTTTGGTSSGGDSVPEVDDGFSETEAYTAGDSFSFSLGGRSHSAELTVINYNEKTVEVTVSSEPQVVVLEVGETEMVDVDFDGDDDMKVTLVSIDSAVKATIKYEGIPTPAVEDEQPSISDSAGDDSGDDTGEVVQKAPGIGVWIWVIIGAILAVLIIYFVSKSSGSKKKR